MFDTSDSEEEAEAPAPAPAGASKKRSLEDEAAEAAKRVRGAAEAPERGTLSQLPGALSALGESDDEAEGEERVVGDGWKREDWRDEALARAGANGAARGSFLDKIANSFVDPRRNAASRAEARGDDDDDGAGRARRPAPARPPQGGHWNRATARQAKEREERLRANPSGVDGRAAYDRPSMHGREMVISVGPSSLPSSCRVTKSHIPPANAKWH